jgi:cytidine deaminase
VGSHAYRAVEEGGALVTVPWEDLARAAWRVRGNAYLIGKTAVGACVLGESGSIFAGCNIEHRYRCHDVHAEVNAIAHMVAAGDQRLRAVVVVAERQRFTPCGGCMDWVFQFGGPECLVGFQSAPEGPISIHTAAELMPLYPE